MALRRSVCKGREEAMNKKFYKVVFNRARGLRVAVQESATSTGKGAGRATTATTTAACGALAGAAAFAPMLLGAALAGMLPAPPVHAQIAGATNVPGTLRPTVLVAPNGVPLVNIQTPSAAGVSRNVYSDFNVGPRGAILNNSRSNAQTQLGGIVQGNPYLASGPARIILNEVNGGNPSQLHGYIEVGGQRAEVIIANPAGIRVDGGGFLNASRTTLTTGAPQFNAIGGLDSFLVQGGTITIDGAGLDASRTDYAAILARAVQVNAGIWASELKVVTGANQVSADHSQVTPTAGTGTAPAFALDVAALGGMYAGKITLIGTEAGLGVRNAGTLQAAPGASALMGAGQLVVTSAGRLENIGTIQATADATLSAPTLANTGTIGSSGNLKVTTQGDLSNHLEGTGGTLEGQGVQLASTGGDIDDRAGTIRQTGGVTLGIAAPTVSNTGGGVIGLEPAPAPTVGTGGTTTSAATSGGTATTTSGTTPTSTTAPAPAPPPIEPGTLTAAGAIRNDGGKIYAGGAITLQSANLLNSGGTLGVANLAVTGSSFSNAGGTLNVSGAFTGHLGSFDNAAGTLNAGSLDIATSGDFNNQDGTLTSATDATLTVGGSANNTRGTISAHGALTANVAGAIDNTAGTLAANQALTLAGQSLDNSQGAIQSAGGNVRLGIGQQLLNTDGRIASGANLTIQAGSLAGTKGALQSTGDLTVTAAQGLTATGSTLAGGNVTLQGAFVDLSGSQNSAANLAITATQGNVTTSGATVATPGTLAITANAQPGQTLVNSAGQLNAGQLQIGVSNLANTNGGEIVQTGAGATTLAVSGSIDNSNSRIASNGQDLSLSGASITNTGGQVEHAGTGTLSITGGSYSGANGTITGNGALKVAMSGDFHQDGGTTYAQQVDLSAGALSNKGGGSLVQAGSGTTTFNVGGALTNSGGTIASNGAIIANAGSMINQGGTLQAAGASDLKLTVANQLDNAAGGKLLAGGNATVAAGSLNNNAGRVTAVGNLNATIGGAATNLGGTLAANGHTTLVAGTLDNSGGTTAAVTGNLSITTSGITTNSGGTLQAGGATTLINGGLSNVGGKVFGHSLSVDTRGNPLDNRQGTLAATTTVALSSGALLNDAGLIQSGGAMTVNTNGQSLSNTKAAGYTNGQGGLTSGGTLDLKSGALDNSAGFIGAEDLGLSTGRFTNANGGLVLGQATVAIDTHGSAYDNRGGQTLAAGDLTIDAGAGTLDNTASLLRAGGTTTLNAASVVNANTLGTGQGIEGTNVAINTARLNNNAGAIRADANATLTSGGTVDNTNGLISAGDTLRIADPNAATPAAKTLGLVNTGGTLVADQRLQIDAATFSGDGQLVSGQDLAVALTQDIVNNADVIANGHLSYGTTGHFTNNARLIAGGTLTVSGNNVDNAVNAEMSGTDTNVNAAGTLTNRGLIDSLGSTQINAGTLNNIGTGRIYGDQVAIGAGALLNDTETLNGATRAGTIAARDTLDIGATTLTNREHALIFSAGDMFIGGALDANRYATGQGGTLDNLSATIESLGNMSISMAQVNNRDTHIQLGPKATTSTQTVSVAPVGGSGFYTLDQVVVIPGQPFVWARNPDGSTGALLYRNGYGIWTTTATTTADTAINADPALIASGGDMTLVGAVYNRDSRIIAGGTLTASNVRNEALKGNYQTTSVATVVNDKGQLQPLVIGPIKTGTVDVGAFEYVQHVNATSGYDSGTAATGSTTAGGGGAGSATGGTRTATIVEVAANVGGVAAAAGMGAAGANGADAAATGGANGQAGQAIPMVVRTSTPNLAVPQASLFTTHPDPSSHYLIETDPRFANYRQWLGSDYLLSSLGLDPNNILKRLGDGFYEQKLIREQVAQLTGYRYLDGHYNDEEQYIALMNAGVTFAREYGLRPGIALTPAQMAQLTSDIVWLVEQTVTLPDGSTQRVLVPQVYVRVRPGDIDGSGALLAGNQVRIDGKDNNLVNTGTIAGRQLVSINANTIDNLGGRISGGQVGLKAQVDINNIGGTIEARDKLILEAGRDINVRTTTASGGMGNTNVDRVAGLYVTNPGGMLVASAGHDANLTGAVVSNQGAGGLTSIRAGNDINLGTVTTSSTGVAIGDKVSGRSTTTREIGTSITTNGATLLNAGQDINARQATVDAGNGLLSLHADRDINIGSGQTTTAGSFSVQSSDKGTFSRTDRKVTGEYSSSTSVASQFSGGLVAMGAGRDIAIEGSHISGTQGVAISAARNLAIVEGRNTSSASTQVQSDKKGIGGLGGLLTGAPAVPTLPYSKANTTGIDLQTDTASASTIGSSQGGVLLQGGNTVFLQGVQVDAAKDINIRGGNVIVQAATNVTSATATTSSRTKGIEPGQILWHDPSTGINARKTTSTTVEESTLTRTTLNGANVSIEAAGTLAMAATTVNTPGTLTLSADNLILGTQTTEHREQTTSQGRDLGYQKFKDKGQSDQATNYNQFNVGSLAVSANRIEAGLGARDSVEALGKQPGMGWVEQITHDPKLDGKIDWQRVEEAHKQWNHEKQGLTPEGAAIVTIVVAYVTAGAASGAGAAAGEAVAVGAGEGVSLAGGGAFLTGTGATISGVVGGAVTAGVTALASQAAIALINNRGDIGAALHDLGSSASVHSLLTAIVTGGVLGGLNMNPTGLPTASGGSQGFLTQLGQNLQAGAVKAVIGTAINGGSFEKNLADALKSALLDTVAAQGANFIGSNFEGMSNKIAHAITGCMVGAARADKASGCAAGALGAVVGEIAAEAYGKRSDTVQFAAMMSAIAVAITGGDAAQINLGSQAGANAAANNYLNHTEAAKLNAAASACAKGDTEQCRVAQRLIDTSIERDAKLTADCQVNPKGSACAADIVDFKIAQASYFGTKDILGGSPAFKYAQQTTQWIPVGSLPDVRPGEVFHGCGGPTNVCVVTNHQDAQGNYIFRPATIPEAHDESLRLIAIGRDAMIQGAIGYGLDAVAIAAGLRGGSSSAAAQDIAGYRIVNGAVVDATGQTVGRVNPSTGLLEPGGASPSSQGASSRSFASGYSANADGTVTGPRGAVYMPTGIVDSNGALIYRDISGGYYTLDAASGRTPIPSPMTSDSQIRQNWETGREFQDLLNKATGLPENTQRITITLPDGSVVTTIPDNMGRPAGIVEAKTDRYLTMSPQLRGQMQVAVNTGQPFTLVVGENTVSIARPVLDEVARIGGAIYRFDPAKQTLTPISTR